MYVYIYIYIYIYINIYKIMKKKYKKMDLLED